MAKFVDFWRKAFHESSLLRNVIVMFTGLLIAIGFALPFGMNAVIDFVTNAVVIMVITQVCGDVWFKITRQTELLCWQYWVGIAGILASDWLFFWASLTVTFPQMFFRVGLCVALAIASGCWFEVAYRKVANKLKEQSIARLHKEWEDAGIPVSVIEKALGQHKEEPKDENK